MQRKDHAPSDLDSRLSKLNAPNSDPDCLYHAITLTADDQLRVIFGACSEWIGYADEQHRQEIRRSRLVYADYVKKWIVAGVPYCIANTMDDLTVFLLAGGNALVERTLAEGMFPRLLGPSPSMVEGRAGFKATRMFEKTALRRAPTPKLRMSVLKRDDRRCRVCGRRPDDDVDLVLHVHHIRPWEKGGITDESNLITLCHTCHTGLVPHEDHGLFDYLSPPKNRREAYLREHAKGVANYRKVGFFGQFDSMEKRQTRGRTPRHRTA